MSAEKPYFTTSHAAAHAKQHGLNEYTVGALSPSELNTPPDILYYTGKSVEFSPGVPSHDFDSTNYNTLPLGEFLRRRNIEYHHNEGQNPLDIENEQ